MDPDELVLSDLHVAVPLPVPIDIQPEILLNYQVVSSQFKFIKPIDQFEVEGVIEERLTQDEDVLVLNEHQKSDKSDISIVEETVSYGYLLDEDGDLILSRRATNHFNVINIDHALATRLGDVGLQVWAGCLLLCDFILDNHKIFDGAVVLELGAGVGLASIVAATAASAVICTDNGTELLTLCQRNVERNKEYFYQSSSDVIKVRRLDWTQDLDTQDSIMDQFSFTGTERSSLYSATILLAADVIYSDDLTDAFFAIIRDVMTRELKKKTLYISLERRLNFTLEDLDVGCPAYTYFCHCVDDLTHSVTVDGVHFAAKLVTGIKQYFVYDRTKYLQLWQIETYTSPFSFSQMMEHE